MEGLVKARMIVLAQLAMLWPLFIAGGHAQEKTSCTNFTVVVKDKLNNMKEGLSPADTKWFRKKIAKKYPGVCYVNPAPTVPVVFYITITPDTYHGTRIVNQTSTQSNPVSGTITDQNGNTADISGTEDTTSTTSTAVPYSFEYGIFTLYVERRLRDGKFEVIQTFQQKGIYNALYGIPLGGRGHHPAHAVIEDAAKWVSRGGLTDPTQAGLQPAEPITRTATSTDETDRPTAKPIGPRDESYWSTATPQTPQTVAALQAKAQAGDAQAQLSLGNLYHNGRSVPQDYAQAAQWYRRAAEQGLSAAQFNLGRMYLHGEGLPQDCVQAEQWYSKAARQGDADAQYMLGLFYVTGCGLKQDFVESYFWLDLAASGNLKVANPDDVVKFRDTVASHLTPAQLSQAQERANKWFIEHSTTK